jgi:transcriptional regulator with XRE-family HTH domain
MKYGEDCMIEGLGQRLKIERIKANLSQKEIAARIGIKESNISSYESGGITPPGEVIMKLATQYGVTTDFLYGIKKKRIMDIDGLSEPQTQALFLVREQFHISNQLMRENGILQAENEKNNDYD